MDGFSSQDEQPVVIGFSSQEAGSSAFSSQDVAPFQSLKGTPVAPGMPTSVAEMGSPDPARGVVDVATAAPEVAVGAVQSIAAPFATAFASPFEALKGSKDPFVDAQKAVDSVLYQPKSNMANFMLQVAGKPFGLVSDAVKYWSKEAGLNKNEATAVETALWVALAGAPDAKARYAARDRFPKNYTNEPVKSLDQLIKEGKISQADIAGAEKVGNPYREMKAKPGRSDFEFPLRGKEPLQSAEVPRGTSSEAVGNKRPVEGEVKGEEVEPGALVIPEPSTPVESMTPSQSITHKAVEAVKKYARAVHDAISVDVLKRTSRASEKVADQAARVAGAYGSTGHKIVDDMIGEVMPGTHEHAPAYLWEKAEGSLSPKEIALKRQADRQRAFGKMLVYDRLIGIWKASLDKAKTAKDTASGLAKKLETFQAEYARQSAGKGSAADQHILPALQKTIGELTEAIAKAKQEHAYFSEKAANVAKEHPGVSNEYPKYVVKAMESFGPELEKYHSTVGKYLDDLYHESKGMEPSIDESQNIGYFTKARVNLIHADLAEPGSEGFSVKNHADSAGKVKAKDTSAGVKKDIWDREAKGTGSYTTNLYGMLKPVVSSRYLNVEKLRLYDVLQKEKLGVLTEIDGPHPEETGGHQMKLIDNISFPEADTETGKTRTTSKNLYVREDIYPEIKQLLKKSEASEIPGFRALTSLQLYQLATDSITHATSQMSLVNKFWGDSGTSRLINKLPYLSPVESAKRFYGYADEVFRDTPEIRKKIRELAEKGVLRDGYHKSALAEWIAKKSGRPGAVDAASGQMLLKFDTAVRLLLNDHFDMMVKEGKLKDTETNRRNFINQVGNYNGRLMEPWMEQVRRTTGPFVVAGMNFNRNAFRYLTGHPGAETTGLRASAQLRLEHLIKPMLFSVAIPAIWNYTHTGNPAGRPGTPPGHLDMGGDADENGKFKTWNIAPFTPFNRGLDVTGMSGYWYGMQQGKTGDQMTKDAAQTALRSWKHPLAGPGLEGMAVALTGHDTDITGRPAKRKTSGAWAGAKESVRAALEKTSPQLYEAIYGENMGGKLATVAAEKTGPGLSGELIRRAAGEADLIGKAPLHVMGLDDSHVARSAAEQMMVDLSQHFDAAPDPETTEYKRIKKEVKFHLRKDLEGGKQYIREQVAKGKLEEKQADRIWNDVYDKEGQPVSDLQTNFKRFGVTKVATDELRFSALKIYSVMNESQKAAVHDILIDKMERAWEKAADPDFERSPEQNELLVEWKKYIPEEL